MDLCQNTTTRINWGSFQVRYEGHTSFDGPGVHFWPKSKSFCRSRVHHFRSGITSGNVQKPTIHKSKSLLRFIALVLHKIKTFFYNKFLASFITKQATAATTQMGYIWVLFLQYTTESSLDTHRNTGATYKHYPVYQMFRFYSVSPISRFLSNRKYLDQMFFSCVGFY